MTTMRSVVLFCEACGDDATTMVAVPDPRTLTSRYLWHWYCDDCLERASNYPPIAIIESDSGGVFRFPDILEMRDERVPMVPEPMPEDEG